jgi:multidrug efflux pump subunit AcrB
VYLFLGSFRATLIPTIAVPVSLIGAFVVLNAIGYSANTVSLLAVVLAIGIVVDDAIVVVEAVEAMMEAHPEMTPAEATIEAMKGLPRRSSRPLVLLSVFVPVAFIPGISGELFPVRRDRPVAMFLSAINALTLSPSLCALLLKPISPRAAVGVVMRSIDRVRGGYGAVVARLVRISIIGVVAVAASCSACMDWAGSRRPALPEEDQGAFFIVIQLPDGASVGRTTWMSFSRSSVLKQEGSIAVTAQPSA